MRAADQIRKLKGREKIVMLTAYDFSSSRLMDGIVDIVLVGDSLGMVALGHKDTTQVTMNDMQRAVEAVSRGARNTHITADMPIGSYSGSENALENAELLLKAGANSVKIENKPEIASYLVKNGIGVIGHIGLTPQTITSCKVQGKSEGDASRLLKESKELDNAGCFALVLECIPVNLARTITQEISIPTIGIGAGNQCDGQVLVSYDMLGLFEEFKPKFVKRYAQLANEVKIAFKQFAKEVKEGKFPTDKYSYH